MSVEDFKRDLQTHRKSLSEKEFFELIFEMLNNELSDEKRDILRVHLMRYSFIDVDRVASYWEQFLGERNPIQREFAALQLARLAEGSSPLAHKILTKYLGQEFDEKQGVDIIMARFRKLWPPIPDEE